MQRLGLAVIACVMAASTSMAAPLPSPIAPASDGKLQCYVPNVATKSCQSLAAYEPAPGGGIVNPATILLSPSPLITMRTVTPVTIEANQVCGVIRPEDIEAATFEIEGQPATEGQTAALRQNVAAAMKALFGRKICTAYVPQGDAMIANASIDGVPQPATGQRVIWVAPGDGFQVRP